MTKLLTTPLPGNRVAVSVGGDAKSHVVMFSSGIGSWAAAKRVAAQYGTDNLILLFADTLIEDEDNYRFLSEAAANVGGKLVRVADGRTPWEVFKAERFLGNSRVAPCSKILKQEVCDRWLAANRDPSNTTIYLGIDWTEPHRLDRARQRMRPWLVEAPMLDPPYLSKSEMLAWSGREGLRPPRLYDLGFPHANCGGFCVKAGQAHFRLLLETLPERYADHERREAEFREWLGKDVSILKRQKQGRTVPLTLTELREQDRQACDRFDWGGCGCYLDSDPQETDTGA